MDKPIPEAVAAEFAVWLAREMPPGTVISSPQWWAEHVVWWLNTVTAAQQQQQGSEFADIEGAIAEMEVTSEGRQRMDQCRKWALEALSQPMQQGGGEAAWDFVDIANRAQAATGRGVMPSTVEAVLHAAGVAAPPSAPVGVAVAQVRRGGKGAPHDALYVGLLPRGSATPEVKEGDLLYLAQQPAAVECPHRTRCDCLASCKYGYASDGATQHQEPTT